MCSRGTNGFQGVKNAKIVNGKNETVDFIWRLFLTRTSRTTTVLTINFLSHLVPSFPFLMFPCPGPISSFVFLSAYSGSRKSTKSDTNTAYMPHALWNVISFNPHKTSRRTITYNFLKIRQMREFPGGLVVRTPHFY